MGTGWLQFEHLTEGKIWEMRPPLGAATASDAITSGGGSDCEGHGQRCRGRGPERLECG